MKRGLFSHWRTLICPPIPGGGPTKRGGGRKCFSHAEGGWAQNVFEVILIWELEVLAIVIGGRKKFPPFKRGCTKSFTLSWGGGAKSF